MEEKVTTLADKTAELTDGLTSLEKTLKAWGTALVTVMTELCNNFATLESMVEMATKDFESRLTALEARTAPAATMSAINNPQDPPTFDHQTSDQPPLADDAVDVTPPQDDSMDHPLDATICTAEAWACLYKNRHLPCPDQPTAVQIPQCTPPCHQPVHNPYCNQWSTFPAHPPPNLRLPTLPGAFQPRRQSGLSNQDGDLLADSSHTQEYNNTPIILGGATTSFWNCDKTRRLLPHLGIVTRQGDSCVDNWRQPL